MRFLIAAAIVALSFVSFEAQAAGSHWKCSGGYVACGSPKKATFKKAKKSTNKSYSKKSYKKKKVAKKAYKKKRNTKTAYAKKKYKSKKSYSGKGTLYGKASFYWQPQAVASGGRFNPNAMTAAHKSLPFGTRVRVTNLNNGRSVTVKINDRGPYIKGRIIDLSRAAAGKIGMRAAGVVRVKVTILGKG